MYKMGVVEGNKSEQKVQMNLSQKRTWCRRLGMRQLVCLENDDHSLEVLSRQTDVIY
jgi:hypothetical protein